MKHKILSIFTCICLYGALFFYIESSATELWFLMSRADNLRSTNLDVLVSTDEEFYLELSNITESRLTKQAQSFENYSKAMKYISCNMRIYKDPYKFWNIHKESK